ncbi:MAG: hypothetical protein Fur0042_31490 [Cyanophyceae cyanobacterium]
MDYETARKFLIAQGTATAAEPDAFLTRLRAGSPPIPGQVTSILVGLKMVYSALEGTPSLSRELAGPLFNLYFESREAYNQGRSRGVLWPPLLDEDIARIGQAVGHILAGEWRNP